MKKYIVHVEEVWIQGYEIEAKSKKDAVIKFRDGEGDIIENDFEYSYTKDLKPIDISKKD